MRTPSPSRRGATAETATPAPDSTTPDPDRWKALGVLAAGLAMIVIDGSIVAVSLPTIISDLSLDLTDAQWVTTSYAVVLSALLLIAGRLGDRLGRRRLLVAGVGVLALVLAPGSPVLLLVAILVVYGLGLGLASAQLTSTVLAPVPAEHSGQGSATQSTVRQLGTALGTAVSGALLSAGLTARGDSLTGRAAGYGQQLTDSAGSILPALRGQGMEQAVLDQLGLVFTDGARIAMAGAAVFLLLGLAGAVAVARAARRAA